MPYIYSTLAADNLYAMYEENSNDTPTIDKARSFLVKGGANVINKKNLDTPRGVATFVTDEQLAILRNNYLFQLHLKNGFLAVDGGKSEVDDIIKAQDMNPQDVGAQLTKEDISNEVPDRKEGNKKEAKLQANIRKRKENAERK